MKTKIIIITESESPIESGKMTPCIINYGFSGTQSTKLT